MHVGLDNYDFLYDRDLFTLGNEDDLIIINDWYGRNIDEVYYDGGNEFPDPTGKSMELLYPLLNNSVHSFRILSGCLYREFQYFLAAPPYSQS